ncbi:MAG: 3-keto-5-aminohexanoate cleavage protein [Pseudomonadota bacterium]
MLQACLNGARSRHDHPQIPVTSEELARDAARVVAQGVAELHVHPRDAQGLETLDPDDTAAVLTAIRRAVPGIPVGLTTREGIRTDPGRGFAQMKAWRLLPDYVSVNLSESDAADVIDLMLAKGIGVEAGLATAADAHKFVTLATARDCLRILVEIDFEKDVANALALADEMIGIITQSGIDLPVLLHGFDQTMWPLYRKSKVLGVDARLGFEDGLHLPDGRIAADNRAIITAADLT